MVYICVIRSAIIEIMNLCDNIDLITSETTGSIGAVVLWMYFSSPLFLRYHTSFIYRASMENLDCLYFRWIVWQHCECKVAWNAHMNKKNAIDCCPEQLADRVLTIYPTPMMKIYLENFQTVVKYEQVEIKTWLNLLKASFTLQQYTTCRRSYHIPFFTRFLKFFEKIVM